MSSFSQDILFGADNNGFSTTDEPSIFADSQLLQFNDYSLTSTLYDLEHLQTDGDCRHGVVQQTLSDHERRLRLIEHQICKPTELSTSSSSSTTSSTPLSPTLSVTAPTSSISTAALFDNDVADNTKAIFVSTSTSSKAAGTQQSSSASVACIVVDCNNHTGLRERAPPRDLQRHVKSRSHVEAILHLTATTVQSDIQFCICDGGNSEKSIPINLLESLGTQRNDG